MTSTPTSPSKGKRVILDLCGGTGAWSRPYAEAGYDVKLITWPDYDVRTYKLPAEPIYGILAAPPCTEFSIAKNHKLSRDYKAGMEIVNACLDIIKKANSVFWALENPIGMLSKFLGKPAYNFQPWWFGDGWTKRTMLWGKFNKPTRKYLEYEDCPQLTRAYIRPGRKTVSIAFNHIGQVKYFPQLLPFVGRVKNDAGFRAITPPAFASAFYEANHLKEHICIQCGRQGHSFCNED